MLNHVISDQVSNFEVQNFLAALRAGANRSKRAKVWLGKKGGKYVQTPNEAKRERSKLNRARLSARHNLQKTLDKIEKPHCYGLSADDVLGLKSDLEILKSNCRL